MHTNFKPKVCKDHYTHPGWDSQTSLVSLHESDLLLAATDVKLEGAGYVLAVGKSCTNASSLCCWQTSLKDA